VRFFDRSLDECEPLDPVKYENAVTFEHREIGGQAGFSGQAIQSWLTYHPKANFP
jgi:hypothetical protein